MAQMGRPLKFKSVAELDENIDAYFKECKDTRDLATITGLAVYLDTNRATLLDYKDGKHDGKDPTATDTDFSYSIKRALSRCEAAIESRAMLGGLNATMSIFTLKNNYGWRDRTEQDVTTGGDKLEMGLNDERITQLIQARAGRVDIQRSGS